jgi:hypothetical protein
MLIVLVESDSAMAQLAVCQLCNGQGGSNKNDNGGVNNNAKIVETTTTKTASTVGGSIGINAGTDMAALCQGLTMQGKHIQHQR